MKNRMKTIGLTALLVMGTTCSQAVIVFSENFTVAPSLTALTTSSTPANNTEITGGFADNKWLVAASADVVVFNNDNVLKFESATDRPRGVTYTITADNFLGADANASLTFDVADIWNLGSLEVAVYGIHNEGVEGDAITYDVLGGAGDSLQANTGIGLYEPANGSSAASQLSYQLIGGLADNDVPEVVKNWELTFNYNGTDDVVLYFAVNGTSTLNKQARIDNIEVSAVPEPSTYALLAGVLTLAFVLRRRLSR